jgi:hypothetical protein
MAEVTSFDDLLDTIQTEAVGAFNQFRDGIFDAANNIIVPQLRLVAEAVWDVIQGLAAGDYTPEAAAELLEGARSNVVATLDAAIELARTEIQAAINRIYQAIMTVVSTAAAAAIDAVLPG